jgi:hypothetical protein
VFRQFFHPNSVAGEPARASDHHKDNTRCFADTLWHDNFPSRSKMRHSETSRSTTVKVPRESMMGNSLHNKIPLGRSAVIDSRPLQALLLVGVCASIGVLWLLLSRL